MGTIILLQFANLIKFLVSSKMNNQMDTSLERVTMVNVLMVWAWKFVHTISRWWQLRYFLCKDPFQLGETIQFDEHIFQMGWFNHQPDFSLRIFLWDQPFLSDFPREARSLWETTQRWPKTFWHRWDEVEFHQATWNVQKNKAVRRKRLVGW